MRPTQTTTTTRRMFMTKLNENKTPSSNGNTIKGCPQGRTGAKGLLMAFVMAIAVMLLHYDASGGSRMLNVVFRLDMVNTGGDQNAIGKISGMVVRSGYGSS